MSARYRKLRMEQMEARQMMAATTTSDLSSVFGDHYKGDVYAYVQNGNLFVNESANAPGSANGVRVSQLANGSMRVEGIQSNDGTGRFSKINGAAYQDFVVTGALNVNLGGGSDCLVIGYVAGAGAPIFSQMSIDLSAPQTLAGAVGGDDDQVLIWGGQSQGNVSINTGRGEDLVFVANLDVGTGRARGNLTINSGAGTDEVTVKGSNIRGNLDIQTFADVSENDIDVVNLDMYTFPDPTLNRPMIVSGSVSVRMGGGDDSLLSTDPTKADTDAMHLGIEVHGSMTVDTGAGNDYAFLRNVRVSGDMTVNMGAGADSLEMRSTKIDGEFGIAPAVNGNLTVQMFATAAEVDNDTAIFGRTGANGNFTVLLGGGDDTLQMTDATSLMDMILDAGIGNDVLQLTRILALDDFFADLGDGNDSLKIVDLYPPNGNSTFYGGTGTDRLNFSGAFPTARVNKIGWEWINNIPTVPVTAVPVNPVMTAL